MLVVFVSLKQASGCWTLIWSDLRLFEDIFTATCHHDLQDCLIWYSVYPWNQTWKNPPLTKTCKNLTATSRFYFSLKKKKGKKKENITCIFTVFSCIITPWDPLFFYICLQKEPTFYIRNTLNGAFPQSSSSLPTLHNVLDVQTAVHGPRSNIHPEPLQTLTDVTCMVSVRSMRLMHTQCYLQCLLD